MLLSPAMQPNSTATPGNSPARQPGYARRFFGSGGGQTLLLFLASLVYYFIYWDHGLVLIDEGHLVHFGERVYNGEVPGRDFHLETYIYGRFYLLGFLFWLFGGPHLLIVRGMWVIMRALCVVMQFTVARRLMPRPYAMLASAFHLAVPGPWHKTPYAFCTLLGLVVLLVFLKNRTRLRLVLCGVVAGFAIQFRQDIGLFLVAVTGLCLLLASRRNADDSADPDRSADPGRSVANLRSWAAKSIYWGSIYLLAILATLAPAAIYLASQDALGLVIEQCFIEKLTQHAGLYDFGIKLEALWKLGDWVACLYFVIPPLVFLATACLLIKRLIVKRACDGFIELLAVFLLGVLSINQAYNYMELIRLLQCSAPLLILTAFIVWRTEAGIGRLLPATQSRIKAALRTAFPAVLGVLLTLAAVDIMTFHHHSDLSVEYRGSIATYNPNNLPVTAPRAGVKCHPLKAMLTNGTVDYLQKRIAPGEPFFMAQNDAMLHFLAERPNPSRFGKFMMPAEPPGRAELVARELRQAAPQYVVTAPGIVSLHRRHPAIVYLNRHYRLDQTFDVGYLKRSYVILKRK